LGYYDKAIAIAPENPVYHAEKGMLLAEAGREKEATDCLNTACKYDPGNAQLHVDLGMLLQKAGNRASAVKNYQEAVSLDPNLLPAHKGLAELLEASEPEKALIHVNSAIGLDIENHAQYFFLKSQIIQRLTGDRRGLEELRKYVGKSQILP